MKFKIKLLKKKNSRVNHNIIRSMRFMRDTDYFDW